MSLDPITIRKAFVRDLSPEAAAREEEMMRRLYEPEDLNDALFSVLVDEVVERICQRLFQKAMNEAFGENSPPMIS